LAIALAQHDGVGAQGVQWVYRTACTQRLEPICWCRNIRPFANSRKSPFL